MNNKYISAIDRIDSIVDPSSFNQLESQFKTQDNLNFPGYKDKLGQTENEAVISGTATIGGYKCTLIVFDPTFFIGSVNTTVGEKIKSAIQHALQNKLPLITITASAGARMQEGIFSLFEFSSILFDWAKLEAANILTINILTNPTLGGVSASFAFAADYQYAEVGATIGFAGKRVIQNASVDKNGEQPTQDSQLLFNNGQFDDLLEPTAIKPTLIQLLSLHSEKVS